MMHVKQKTVTTIATLCAAPAAWAHAGEHSSSFLATLMHTITASDHLLGALGLAALAAVIHHIAKRSTRGNRTAETEGGN